MLLLQAAYYKINQTCNHVRFSDVNLIHIVQHVTMAWHYINQTLVSAEAMPTVGT
jgi:hypothetical protein